MKIIHLNTYQNNGGAGRACLRLNQALIRSGADSEVWVNFSFEEKPRAHNFSAGFLGKWVTAAKIISERLIGKLFQKSVPVPFSFPVFGRDISDHPALKNADIIHLHWISHAFLRPKDLMKLNQLNKPIVWTFHDSNAFTGGCHVRYSCPNYQNECGNCPVLKNANPNDWSHNIWKAKAKAYAQLPFTIIAPSRWMAQSVKESKLLGVRQVEVIPNTLDTRVFKPYLKSDARKKLGLPADKFILMSGFMPSRKDLHKGTAYLLQALEILIIDYQIPDDEIELVIFGNQDQQSVPFFPVKTTFLGTISDDDKLALGYSAADAFLAPSLEDNLPNTVMESLACGTPVVAFNTGGIPDMVQHLKNGYLAEYCSAADFAEGILWILKHPERAELNYQARLTVEENYSEAVIAAKHIKLYQTLLNR